MNIRQACKKIIAIGRNYAEHAKELGNKVPDKNPIIFGKPVSSIITQGENIQIPRGWNELHHEIELGIIIGKRGKHIKCEEADEYILGYVLALDMTARSIQNELKKNSHPWLLAKGFDTSCPISDFIPKDCIKDFDDINLKLNVNGVIKQNGKTSDMIFKLPQIISYISTYFTLDYGDLILTGTPSGVSGVRHGDVLEGCLMKNDQLITSMKYLVVNEQ